MTSPAFILPRPKVIYPDTDGAPIAENTLQFEWIAKIKGGLDHLFADAPNVFVAGDLFWYPVEDHPEIVAAPDAMVIFGAPKGHRLSYLQFAEGNVPPQVAFEILSHNNRPAEMARKFEFYRRYGVEEYYVYDPDPRRLDLIGYLRSGDQLVEVPTMDGHVSPRLKVRFEMTDAGLRIVRPDGKPFLAYEELADREELQGRRADQERGRADAEQRRAEAAERRADRAAAEVDALRQRLRALGQDPAV